MVRSLISIKSNLNNPFIFTKKYSTDTVSGIFLFYAVARGVRNFHTLKSLLILFLTSQTVIMPSLFPPWVSNHLFWLYQVVIFLSFVSVFPLLEYKTKLSGSLRYSGRNVHIYNVHISLREPLGLL